MLLMALDHTRDFFGLPGDPTNLATASAALFLTRFVTHICAPTFFLLTGVGARLSRSHRSPRDLSQFLLRRGLWLIVLETIVLRCLAYQFNVDFHVTMLLVLWALGWSMITLAGLVPLGPRAAGTFGLVLIVAHNAVDSVRLANPLWTILHGPGIVLSAPVVFAAYPLIPWIGVTALGYALGGIYASAPTEDGAPGGWPAGQRHGSTRSRWLWQAGLLCLVAFVMLRWMNVYGDPSPWTRQPSALFALLSFLNTTKYPPSLAFLLMTLGPALLLLAASDRGVPAMLRPVTVFGRVPLFYYAVHFFTLHALAVMVCLWRFGTAHWMFESPDLARYPFTPPPGWGYPLPVVYAIWLSVVALLYPLCVRFGRLKRLHPGGWLGYL